MTGWLIALGYVIGCMVVWRKAYVWLVEDQIKLVREPLPEADLSFDAGMTILFAVLSLIVSLFWPFVAVLYLPYRLITAPTPTQQAQIELVQRDAERRELEQLRRLAKEYDLPMSDEDKS